MADDEKAGRLLDTTPAEYRDVQSNSRVSVKLRHFLLLSFFASAWLVTKALNRYRHAPTEGSVILFALEPSVAWTWTTLEPSEKFNWTKCYGSFGPSFQCTRLSVPLDYSEPDGPKAAVALIKYPSSYGSEDENYRGPILFNPGGPGGSGVTFMLLAASAMREILGGAFDLISFDPRGVGETTPYLRMFHSQIDVAALFMQFEGSVNASTTALGRNYAIAQHLGDMANQSVREVSRHVSTPVVARDMLSIVQAAGQEKLQYWGFSYGTVLGATFAAMFPDKVGRVVIDGVEDAENYYAGLWDNNLRDTDAALDDIYRSCVLAGPTECAVYENSTAGVRTRVDSLLEKLRMAPVGVRTEEGRYVTVDYAMARNAIFRVLYDTHGLGKYLMNALANLERGDGSMIYAVTVDRVVNSLLACSCPPGAPNGVSGPYDTLGAIACGDTEGSSESLEDLRNAYGEMALTSLFAEVWFPRVLCSGWKIRGKELFKGSFEQNTSHPLLVIGNVADPVTPLWAAKKMAKGFKDAVVLTQNSSGHCSIAAASICTSKAIRNYFANGTLPEEGTVCQVESSIFKSISDDYVATLSSDDRALLEASRVLHERYPIARFGGLI